MHVWMADYGVNAGLRKIPIDRFRFLVDKDGKGDSCVFLYSRNVFWSSVYLFEEVEKVL